MAEADRIVSALSALGGDLTVSISFAVATELLVAADEAEVQTSSLVGVLLALSVVLGATPDAAAATAARVRALCTSSAAARAASDDGDGDDDGQDGILAFIGLFVRILQRIAASVCVQLVAASVASSQPLRSVRIVTLLGVAVFFVFVENAAFMGRVPRRAR
jgi:hypothetical protein